MLPDRIARARKLAAGWVDSGSSPAMSLLEARRGVIVLHEGLGVMGPEADAEPLTADTVFPVMSVTKSLTAALVMGLVEDGLIGLNRPLVEYIPEFRGEWKEQVLLHHLLTHTWGENIDGILEALVKRAADRSESASCETTQHPKIERVLQAVYQAPLARPPGEVMFYGAFGYMMLGEIIRRVTGRAYADVAQERILDPLGMRDSWLVVPESVRSRIVRRSPDAPFGSPNLLGPGLNSRESEEMPGAASGLYTTSRDLAVFAQTFLNGGSYGGVRILSRPTVEAMMRNQIPNVPFEFKSVRGPASMGYGWFVDSHVKWRAMGSLQSLGTINHMGMGESIVWADPEREIVGVYLEVLINMTEDFEALWNFDLFQNAVTACVDD